MKEKLISSILHMIEVKDDISPSDTSMPLIIDSLSFIKLVVDCENEFNIKFEDDMLDITCFRTIEEFVNYIIKLMKTSD
ncbi:MAG: hypothetical protein K0R00_248 [Herbinix sp.]|jgi:acyl carrier protein|nr:hypothetical protein [Herbinix sp.]